MKINIGDTLKWVARAGTLTGKVTNIKLDLNGAGDTIPWLLVQEIEDHNGKKLSGCMLPGNDGYFKMMKLEVV
jgi:hypothetical protein